MLNGILFNLAGHNSNIINNSNGKHTEIEPEFLETLKNTTVVKGREVSFTCVVNNLGQFRVSIITFSCSL